MDFELLNGLLRPLRYDKLSDAAFKEIQSQRLQALVRYSVENSKLWREWFAAAHLTAADISSLDDLRKIPLISKKQLVSRPLEDRLTMPVEECVPAATSGTTGGPMVVYYDRKSTLSTMLMLTLRSPRWVQLPRLYKSIRIMYDSAGQAMAEAAERQETAKPQYPHREKILGSSKSVLSPIYDHLHKQVYVASDIREVTKEIEAMQPHVIWGNTSYLRMLAKYVKEEKNAKIHPKCTLATGEPFDEPTRKNIESTLDCAAYQMYGSNELGPVAIECREKQGMHIFAERYIVEVVDARGEPLAAGEQGELVVTGLMNRAMPLIRYKTGDIGALSYERCSCGRTLPKITSVEGRAIDFIFSKDRQISPKRIITLMYSIEALPRCQLVQEAEATFRLRVFLTGKADQQVQSAVEQLLELLKGELGANITINVSLEAPQRLKAKFREVISERTVVVDNRWITPY